jgi:quercetin dioxygenase-like cupin family protein
MPDQRLASPPAQLAVRPAELCALVERVRTSEVWDELIADVGDERRKHLVARTPAWELWLLGWRQGHSVEFHDHGGSHAALTVLRGSLVEVTLVGDGSTSRILAPGDVHLVGSAAVHDVVNLTPHDAWSLHAYSPRLRAMSFYDPVTHRVERVDAVEPIEPLFDAEAFERWWAPEPADR